MWKTKLIALTVPVILITAPFLIAYADDLTIPNPLTGSDTFEQLIQNIANSVTKIAIIFASFAIVIIGFKFVMAAASGNTSGLTEARKMFLWVLIGTAIVVGAAQLADAVINFAKGL